MPPDFDRAHRIGEFWATRRPAPSPSCWSTARRTGRCGRCSSACCASWAGMLRASAASASRGACG